MWREVSAGWWGAMGNMLGLEIYTGSYLVFMLKKAKGEKGCIFRIDFFGVFVVFIGQFGKDLGGFFSLHLRYRGGYLSVFSFWAFRRFGYPLWSAFCFRSFLF